MSKEVVDCTASNARSAFKGMRHYWRSPESKVYFCPESDHIGLFQDDRQKKILTFLQQGGVTADVLRTALALTSKSKLLNTELLSFFLKNPERIPKEWNRKRIFFLGDIFKTAIKGEEKTVFMYLEKHWFFGWQVGYKTVNSMLYSGDYIAVLEPEE